VPSACIPLDDLGKVRKGVAKSFHLLKINGKSSPSATQTAFIILKIVTSNSRNLQFETKKANRPGKSKESSVNYVFP
jgi:hypothetical protein